MGTTSTHLGGRTVTLALPSCCSTAPKRATEEGAPRLQGRTFQYTSYVPQGAAASHPASRSMCGIVVAFPGHKPTDPQLRYVLDVLVHTGLISVRHLKMEADLPEALLIKCVERLADAGLLTAEDRKDDNALRLIASATDAGRRLLAIGVEGDSFLGSSTERGGVG